MFLRHLTMFCAITTAVFATRDHFSCDINHETNVCWFRNLARNMTHPRFVPESNNIASNDVTKVYLGGGHGSHMHFLTSDICEAFSNLQDYNGQLLYLHVVEKDVFEACHELEVVNLEVNRIENLDVGLFKNNRKLKKIYLGDNLLQTIDMQMFEGLNDLEELDLHKNLFKVFPVSEMPKLPQLHWLALHNNLLTGLDVQQLYEKSPKMAESGAHLRLCPGNQFEKTKDPMFTC